MLISFNIKCNQNIRCRSAVIASTEGERAAWNGIQIIHTYAHTHIRFSHSQWMRNRVHRENARSLARHTYTHRAGEREPWYTVVRTIEKWKRKNWRTKRETEQASKRSVGMRTRTSACYRAGAIQANKQKRAVAVAKKELINKWSLCECAHSNESRSVEAAALNAMVQGKRSSSNNKNWRPELYQRKRIVRGALCIVTYAERESACVELA